MYNIHNMLSKLYQCSVRFSKHEKYESLVSELYHPVKSFNEKLYICEA